MILLMIIHNPLQARCKGFVITHITMTTFKTSNNCNLVVVGNSLFALVVYGRGYANSRTMISSSFMLGIVVAIHAVV